MATDCAAAGRLAAQVTVWPEENTAGCPESPPAIELVARTMRTCVCPPVVPESTAPHMRRSSSNAGSQHMTGTATAVNLAATSAEEMVEEITIAAWPVASPTFAAAPETSVTVWPSPCSRDCTAASPLLSVVLPTTKRRLAAGAEEAAARSAADRRRREGLGMTVHRLHQLRPSFQFIPHLWESPRVTQNPSFFLLTNRGLCG